MMPIEDFKHCMDRENFKYAGQLLVKIVNCAIGHINDKPALEVHIEKKNWTTAPFHFLVHCPKGVKGIW